MEEYNNSIDKLREEASKPEVRTKINVKRKLKKIIKEAEALRDDFDTTELEDVYDMDTIFSARSRLNEMTNTISDLRESLLVEFVVAHELRRAKGESSQLDYLICSN